MNISIAFARTFFLSVSVLLITIYTIATCGGITPLSVFSGLILGSAFALLLMGFDSLLKRFNLKAFNTTILGLFLGYLMSSALLLLVDSIFLITELSLEKTVKDSVEIVIFLFGTYVGLMMTVRAAEEVYISLPFIRFKPTTQKKKDLLLDSSILSDPRIIDFAASGLLDKHLIVPRFVIKELYEGAERGDESVRIKSRRSLDVLKKLEGIPSLELHFNETDFTEVKEGMEKLVRLGRLLDANILTADINRIQTAMLEGVRVINIHTLSNALKPIMQAGEYIKIKVQRYGKEAKQGVGYLDDGTMVVINGGGEFIGDVVKAQVLSVKHTSSGRMVFSNVDEASLMISQNSFENNLSKEDALHSS